MASHVGRRTGGRERKEGGGLTGVRGGRVLQLEKDGKTPVWRAAEKGHAEAAGRLIEAKCDIDDAGVGSFPLRSLSSPSHLVVFSWCDVRYLTARFCCITCCKAMLSGTCR
eukprot:3161893-Rhodomonas_salina.1